jgi:hypothetical protein
LQDAVWAACIRVDNENRVKAMTVAEAKRGRLMNSSV